MPINSTQFLTTKHCHIHDFRVQEVGRLPQMVKESKSGLAEKFYSFEKF